MRRLLLLALLLSASALPAQSFWDSSVRLAPQFQSYDLKAPFGEKISQFSFPMFVMIPVFAAFTLDVGAAYASAKVERETVDSTGAPVTSASAVSGLTDTQVRATYVFGQDFVVLTAGLNLPSGSATIEANELDASTRIGNDFLMFPISGFGSGMGFTGGVAIARPVGAWNVGFGASLRHSSEYEPFRDASGATLKFQPGPEYRARMGVDHPYGTGSIAFGLTFSQYGDDKSNALTFNSGNRYIGQFSVSNALREAVDYTFAIWNMYRTSGTLIDNSPSPSGNITSASMAFAVRMAGNVAVEPSVETRVWSQEGSKTSYLGAFGTRVSVNRGGWAIVPGLGFSIGTMDGATLTGMVGTLGIRLGN